jgi:curved DNA-binding protein
MKDYYQILGVPKNAQPDEIKKAYRKLAGQHHPDKGGDTAKFQEIQTAYETLSDPQKRAEYDNPQTQWSFNSRNFNGGSFEDIFNNFGFGGFRQQVQRNRSVNIRVDVTLKDVIFGKEVVGSIRLPSGQDQAIEIKIPPGVGHGDNIRFRGLGDNSISSAPRGDLIAQIIEVPHPDFVREGYNLISPVRINAFEAMLGKTVRITTAEDKQLDISIPAGIYNGQMIKCKSHGIPVGQSGNRGDLYIRIEISTPQNISKEDIKILQELNQRYGS